MKRLLPTLALLLLFGAVKLPLERSMSASHRAAFFHGAKLDLPLREQLGQGAFLAALSGFRGVLADFLCLEAFTAWENTQWSRVLLLYNQITALQPRQIFHWEMGANYMAYDAAAAAMQDKKLPREALRVKAAREYMQMGVDLLEQGIRNNPDRGALYRRLGDVYMNKLKDPEKASAIFSKAAQLPDARGYEKRFAAYELAKIPGREQEAYEMLLKLYREGHRTQGVKSWLAEMEKKLGISPSAIAP